MMLKGLTQAEVDAFEADRLAEGIRAEVRRIMDATDKTQMPDAGERFDQKAWAKYRKAICDVTKQKGFPKSVQWPIPPEVLP